MLVLLADEETARRPRIAWRGRRRVPQALVSIFEPTRMRPLRSSVSMNWFALAIDACSVRSSLRAALRAPRSWREVHQRWCASASCWRQPEMLFLSLGSQFGSSVIELLLLPPFAPFEPFAPLAAFEPFAVFEVFAVLVELLAGLPPFCVPVLLPCCVPVFCVDAFCIDAAWLTAVRAVAFDWLVAVRIARPLPVRDVEVTDEIDPAAVLPEPDCMFMTSFPKALRAMRVGAT
ncbi:hypothetical protein EON00_00525 [Burkholderia sp. ISTR5]|nr:hypothetical protein [Burkholderia sp. ISTR5]